jgi:hypothetical protein
MSLNRGFGDRGRARSDLGGGPLLHPESETDRSFYGGICPVGTFNLQIPSRLQRRLRDEAWRLSVVSLCCVNQKGMTEVHVPG